ncbi:LysR family transcriptional regulator [Martelella sp. FOR1707]
MNFRNLDLNLLRVLDALLDEPNTTRAGTAIGLSQPAVSSALKRLRDLTGDALFEREGNSLVATPYALGLREPVRSALDGLEQAFAGRDGFDPNRSQRSFLLGASDFFAELLMPALVDRMTRAAPDMRLKMLPSAPDQLAGLLTGNGFDMIVSIAAEVPGWIERRFLFSARNVVVARHNHPGLQTLEPGATMPLSLFCEMPQAIFSATRDFTHFEDVALSRIGRARHVRFTLPGYFAVARVVGNSDIIGVLPASLAQALQPEIGLSVYRLPFEMPLIDLYLYWRSRDTRDAEHSWLREEIVGILAPLNEAALAAAPVADDFA